MIFRLSKALLVLGVALYYSFVVLNNLTDYDSNYQFVRQVLMMDSTFPGNHGMWRALNSPLWHTWFYLVIILWEILTTGLCWWGGIRLLRASAGRAVPMAGAATIAVAGLTSGLLMWLVAFLAVGSEWFLMWQSKSANGQEVAFHMFTVLGVVLLLVVQPDSQE